MRYWLNDYQTTFVYTKLRFYTAWAEPGRSSQLTGCRAGKVNDCLYRRLSTQAVIRIIKLLGELTGSPWQGHAIGNSRRDAEYQGPYCPH